VDPGATANPAPKLTVHELPGLSDAAETALDRITKGSTRHLDGSRSFSELRNRR